MLTTIYHCWRADFYDRIRRRNYLVTLMCMAILTLLFFPPSDASYATVVIGGYRGIYNSAWIGATLAILNVLFLPIICFYLIKNAVERDRDRGISELIAPTPIKKFEYIIGKWLSNLTLLTGIMLFMSLTSIFVQLWHGEDYSIDLLQLLLPQIIYVLPILAVISAVAILFETIGPLRGGIGNVLYFFLWVGLLVNVVEDSSGIGDIIDQIRQAVIAYDPMSNGSTNIGIALSDDFKNGKLQTFTWLGITYTSLVISPFTKMMALGLIILIVATVFFDRFKKTADQSATKMVNNKLEQKLTKLLQPISKLFENTFGLWSFTSLIRQEFLLLIRGGSIWWYLTIAGLLLGQLIAPLETVRTVILPASWLLCVLVFSPMGHRELQSGTDSLIFSCISPIKKQFPAMLLAGILVALLVVSGALLRFLLSGEFFSIVMLLTGALFIPSLALACGALTRTSRTFEILFLTLWYIYP